MSAVLSGLDNIFLLKQEQRTDTLRKNVTKTLSEPISACVHACRALCLNLRCPWILNGSQKYMYYMRQFQSSDHPLSPRLLLISTWQHEVSRRCAGLAVHTFTSNHTQMVSEWSAWTCGSVARKLATQEESMSKRSNGAMREPFKKAVKSGRTCSSWWKQ